MRDLEEAHRWYERSAAAAVRGSLGYALSLARRATDERGRPKIADHLRRAAEAGLPTAIYLLGVLAEQGGGGAQIPSGRLQLYRQAAEKGHRAARFAGVWR